MTQEFMLVMTNNIKFDSGTGNLQMMMMIFNNIKCRYHMGHFRLVAMVLK